MATLTIRDLPEDLQEFLKADALANHRSVNKQVVVALDEYRRARQLGAKPGKSPEELLATVRKIQAAVQLDINNDPRTDEEILGYNAQGHFD